MSENRFRQTISELKIHTNALLNRRKYISQNQSKALCRIFRIFGQNPKTANVACYVAQCHLLDTTQFHAVQMTQSRRTSEVQYQVNEWSKKTLLPGDEHVSYWFQAGEQCKHNPVHHPLHLSNIWRKGMKLLLFWLKMAIISYSFFTISVILLQSFILCYKYSPTQHQALVYLSYGGLT